MQIVGGELYCEIFPIFLFFPNALTFWKKNIFSNYLCLIIFNFILDALLNPYLKKRPDNFSRGYLMIGSVTQ